ncbi:TrlF family ATPase, partial [Staphylococcus epidermidis]
MKIKRGSDWNIGDLNIHTPGTWQNNQFKNRDWEKYISTIESKSVKVLGITNYFNIEDYFIVKDFKDNGRLKNVDLLLPNVELRLDNFTSKDKGINLHIIVSNKVDE